MIDVRLLLDFAAVGEALSFSAAARKTGVAQPRLSAQIRKLEAILGMALFERTTRRASPSPLRGSISSIWYNPRRKRPVRSWRTLPCCAPDESAG